MCNVTPVNTAIISYGGTSIPILGKVRLRVRRGDFSSLLDCNLVDSKKVRPIHLNSDKLQLRMKEAPLIGHVATGEGLREDPSKVRAIREMPPPENVAGV